MESTLREESNSIRETVECYKNTVFRVAFTYCKNRADAEDVFQDVFLQYFKTNPQFTGEPHKKAWFIRVTVNCCKNLLKSSWFKKTQPIDGELINSLAFEDPRQSDLFCAVMELPEKYRAVVHLYYYEDYPVREIAQLLVVKETTVQTRLQRARGMLRAKLKEEWKHGQAVLQENL